MANKRYIFSLVGVNIEKTEEKYGISNTTATGNDSVAPENTTKIDDLDNIKQTPDIISFLDESKRLRKCTVSMIDHKGICLKGTCKYKCFWDKNYLPTNISPLACPIRYISNRGIKTYPSEISKDTYRISEQITRQRTRELVERKDPRITIERNNYYETDGIFCSFNCMFAFIEDPENKSNPLYRNSRMLALEMYKDIYGDSVDEIMLAPHWRNLSEFGGTMTIEKFRDTFNKVEYVDQGMINCVSIGRLYEARIKF
jgi:hypothetical protein